MEWDQNGNKISDGIFKSGKRWNGYFGDEHYINGAKGSLFIQFFKSGKKKIEGVLIEGQKTGPWSEWFANGNRKYTGDYRGGKRDGKWIVWDQKGNEIINGIYRNDLPWKGKFENYYYSNGKIAQEYV